MKLPANKIPLILGWLITILISFLIGLKFKASPSSGAHPAPRSSTLSARDSVQRSQREKKSSQSQQEPSSRRPIAHETAISEILSSFTGTSKTKQLLKLLDTLDSNEFPEFVESFRNNPLSSIHQSEYNLILKAWTELDPYGAISHIEQHDTSSNARRTVMKTWAGTDPLSAMAKAQELGDTGRTNDWTVGLAAGLAASDPDSAMALLEGLQPGSTLNASINAVIPHVLQQGFDHTRDWLLTVSDDSVRTTAVRTAARGLASMELERSGTWVAEFPDTALRRDASEEVARIWAKEDLDAAREWTENLPEDTRTEAAEGIAREMAKTDPQGTADWLTTMGDNPDLDGARRTFLDSIQRTHPEIALASIPSLSDENQHRRYYSNILTRWERRDQSAAHDWIATNVQALPESVVKHYYPSE